MQRFIDPPYCTVGLLAASNMIYSYFEFVGPQVAMWRHYQVGRGRNVFRNPPGKIETRAVTGTEIATHPVITETLAADFGSE